MLRLVGVVVALAWTAGLLAPGAVAAPDLPAGGSGARTAAAVDRLDVWTGRVTTADLATIGALGVDRHEVELTRLAGQRGTDARVEVRVVLSGREAARLRAQGVDLSLARVGGLSAAERATRRTAEGLSVFRPYSGPGGLLREFRALARAHPRVTELVRIGRSLQGRPIVALRVTRNADRVRDGRRPAVAYVGAQHAREWITPEMIRRLARSILRQRTTRPDIRRLVASRELWFVPVANPDGYDWTFEPGQRLWRKNLRDNNGDGVIDTSDGVDLNRNFPTRWGYDNEGSSPVPTSQTYRGPSPASEPETRALVRLARRVDLEFFVNYHSAAELLLYGTGWQVSTPTPDDRISEALVGDDEEPAVPGYDPDISAELYITNGDTDTDLTERFGALGFTPEMSTCEAASDSVPDDEWVAEDCGSGFEFPDDEGLVQAEFLKNVPFALSVARSAGDPDDPVSSLGLTAPTFDVDRFKVSAGGPQEVAVVAKRAVRDLRLVYRIGNGPLRRVTAPEWTGGERYGHENDRYYAEFRGLVRGARDRDSVQAWFTGRLPGQGRVASPRFRYRVDAAQADVLVLANEDYTGVSPEYPADVTEPKYAAAHVAAVEAGGRTAQVWDVDARGVPHDLGVLSHYDAVLWYLGDNRITADPEDLLTETPLGDLPDLATAERQQALTLAVRDYLNEGGKLVHAGETAQFEGLPGFSEFIGGLYYGLNGDPRADCVISPRPGGGLDGLFEDCLLLADDFRQYWLGAMDRISQEGTSGAEGVVAPYQGWSGTFGGPATEDNPVDEAGVFGVTSDTLPVTDFPQFASEGVAEYLQLESPFAPVEGQQYAAALHADDSYMRLARTVDIPAGASSASLDLQLSLDIEEGYDHFLVEVRPVGTDDWTTLPEAGGLSSSDSPTECADDPFLLRTHPFLTHYLDASTCTSPGSTGAWNSVTGSTGGWTAASYDLLAFAGQEVEVALSYVTDPGFGGVGAFVDDTAIVVDGVRDADGFEGPGSAWSPAPAPADSPAGGGGWQIGPAALQLTAGVATDDSLLLGFGLEQLSSDQERADLLDLALDRLLG